MDLTWENSIRDLKTRLQCQIGIQNQTRFFNQRNTNQSIKLKRFK